MKRNVYIRMLYTHSFVRLTMDGSAVISRGSKMDKKPAPRQEISFPSAVMLQDSRRPGPLKEPGCSSAEQIRQRNIAKMTVPRQNCVHMPVSLLGFSSFLLPESPRPGNVSLHHIILISDTHQDPESFDKRKGEHTRWHIERNAWPVKELISSRNEQRTRSLSL